MSESELVDAAFTQTVDVFRDIIRRQPGTGGQLAIRSGNRLLVSVAAGHAGEVPWDRSTVVNVWSVSKAIAAVGLSSALAAVGRSLETPIAELWPELEAASGHPIAVMLGHRLGLVGLRRPASQEDMLDSKGLACELETTQPWWEPGTDFGYHSWSYGVLVDELFRRLGTELDEVLAPALAQEPDASASFGATDHEVAPLTVLHVAQSRASIELGLRQDDATIAALRNPAFNSTMANGPLWPKLHLPSAKCMANADGATLVLSALLEGGAVSSTDRAQHLAGLGRGVDHVLGDDREFTAGLVVGHPGSACPYSTDGRLRFGHDGSGGSFVCLDPEADLVLAWFTNGMGRDINADPRKLEILEAFDADTR